ncbi:unnamed protein product, partial [Effrenium voratum]
LDPFQLSGWHLAPREDGVFQELHPPGAGARNLLGHRGAPHCATYAGSSCSQVCTGGEQAAAAPRWRRGGHARGQGCGTILPAAVTPCEFPRRMGRHGVHQ